MIVGPYTLKPHQVRAIEGSRRKLREGSRRILIKAPCGAGKTVISSAIMAAAMERGKRTMFLASGRKLIDQKSSKLRCCGIPHAVLMNEREWVAGHSCVVASKDTFDSRVIERGIVPFPDADVVIVDEAHLACAEGWQEIYKAYESSVLIGLTATPALGNGKSLPGWDALVDGGTYEELIARGDLVPARVYAPFAVDMKGVSVGDSGEYVQKQMAARYDDKVLVGDFLRDWKRYAEDRLTGFFAASVKASISMAAEFNAAGIPARHIDADTDDMERLDVFDDAREGRIKVICNYGVIRVGVDIPEMECVQLGVSMNSLNTYLQSVGRGFRAHTFPGDVVKTDCIVIDHGGNVHKHGWPTEDHEWSLDDPGTVQERTAKKSEAANKPREPLCCPECGAMRERGPKCLNCGHVHKRSGLKVRTVDGELKPLERKKAKKQKQTTDAQKLWMTCVCICANRGMTFKQAAWLFKQRSGDWPPETVGPLPPFEKRGFKVRDLYPNLGRRKAKA